AALRGQAHPVAAPVVLPAEVAVVIPAGREAQREHETALLARVEVLLGAGVEREVSPQAPRPVEPGRAVRGAGGRPVADVVRSRGAEPAAADPGLELVAGTQRRAVPARGQVGEAAAGALHAACEVPRAIGPVVPGAPLGAGACVRPAGRDRTGDDAELAEQQYRPDPALRQMRRSLGVGLEGEPVADPVAEAAAEHRLIRI